MIVVVDYGMGNLRSVSKALEHVGGKVLVSSDKKDIEKADKIVLPGVGAFKDAIEELHKFKLFDAIRKYLKDKRPFLGICLGLQLLFRRSEENPDAQGLGAYGGQVERFKSQGVKIPHMGWNQVEFQTEHPILNGIPDKSFFYFVHSYYAVPENPALNLGLTSYGDDRFPAILAGDSMVATQFHPEKSQEAGLQILKNFLSW